MNPIHKDTAAGGWHRLSLPEQLGNIGSEIGRAVKWNKNGKPDRADKALQRAFELMFLTVSDKRWHSRRLRELCRAKELMADVFYGDNKYNSSPEAMEKYFFQYAILARKQVKKIKI